MNFTFFEKICVCWTAKKPSKKSKNFFFTFYKITKKSYQYFIFLVVKLYGNNLYGNNLSFNEVI